MRFAYFTHSLVSDWNHGNAHFLRGVATELQRLGHHIDIYEPANGWSLRNLRHDEGDQPVQDFARAYPQLHSTSYNMTSYDMQKLELDTVLDDVDVVVVHEWNEPSLVAAIGKHRDRTGHYHLLFHDTHHRAATAPDAMRQFQLDFYDGVLAFGDVIRQIYLDRGWVERAWVWHEAADTRRFKPLRRSQLDQQGDLVWVGNWGDEERSEELRELLIKPVQHLQLDAQVYGVRYPQRALQELSAAGITYRGWLANYFVPDVFARFRCTVHIPRRPYREELTGVPTIRVFEALACGIPLICQRWDDTEQLFTPGSDYLLVDNPDEMTEALQAVLSDHALRTHLTQHGLETIRERHTCAHRVEELLHIVKQLDGSAPLTDSSSTVSKG